jgi:hypothetical protein
MAYLYFISLLFLALSSFVDFYTGKLADKYNAIETNKFGVFMGCFWSIIIMSAITLPLYVYMPKTTLHLIIYAVPCFGFACWHFWAGLHNYKLYKRLEAKAKIKK